MHLLDSGIVKDTCFYLERCSIVDVGCQQRYSRDYLQSGSCLPGSRCTTYVHGTNIRDLLESLRNVWLICKDAYRITKQMAFSIYYPRHLPLFKIYKDRNCITACCRSFCIHV